MHSRSLTLALVFATIATSASARLVLPQQTFKPGKAPTIDRDDIPWGMAVDGIACRLLANRSYCLGQAVNVIIEVKNVSKQRRYLMPRFDVNYFGSLSISGPVNRNIFDKDPFTTYPKQFAPIEAGEVKRMPLSDLAGPHWQLRGAFTKPGKYTLTYSYRSPKPPTRMAVGSRTKEDGTKEKTYDTAPPEMLKHAWVNSIEASPVTVTIAEPSGNDLTVHEWGVFTMFNDMHYANMNRKQEWGSLPKVVYRQFPNARLRFVPAVWDKPVVYFYSERPNLRVRMEVDFGLGLPVAWWPAAADPVDDNTGRFRFTETGLVGPRFNKLIWDLWLGENIPSSVAQGAQSREQWIKVKEFDLGKGWWNELRLKEATPVTVAGTPLVGGRACIATQVETERFVYYDGLVPSPDYVKTITVKADSITLQNDSKFPITPMLVIDRRKADARFAIVDQIAAKKKVEINLKPIGDLRPAQPATLLRATLLESGLTKAETDSLMSIWQQGFFERPGITAIHLLPREVYDAMLPIKITPKPVNMVRVGVAIHANLEGAPSIRNQALGLIELLNDDDFKVREKATRQLIHLGPLGLKYVQQALTRPPSEEVKDRCEQIIEAVDTTSWFKDALKKKE